MQECCISPLTPHVISCLLGSDWISSARLVLCFVLSDSVLSLDLTYVGGDVLAITRSILPHLSCHASVLSWFTLFLVKLLMICAWFNFFATGLFNIICTPWHHHVSTVTIKFAILYITLLSRQVYYLVTRTALVTIPISIWLCLQLHTRPVSSYTVLCC